ncbi:sensor histidine kinase [Bifidobacterium psychraerophilum]|jgi:two-component system sensor histidine kinase SenX3|uniref:Sensor-like histidine kinase SenX3 n=1 Tax=Bifidobacterium psychraerophilum TaxID=218140 RepID=A0A087CNL9_9BIFI|nr:ATP-binding protein [Bifidobacterium psychraerophilum]KFI84869.1 His Kinase [Bifidobacterium psychraerophilum]MCI1805377.1 ATP-binding protein [Bifidobacterium psychraerophilum]MCI2177363.1 ATP-binding protein [Bifidobacterium psychraerophilum]MCI2182896.1 ATP-binding protein [Bifidobacterium psychraerophilum]PKA94000.1 two-component system sensor histidine kinase SenX3 [Bifidobacterium psychraerophilum DSM 22366]
MLVNLTWSQMALLGAFVLVVFVVAGRAWYLAGMRTEHNRVEALHLNQHSIFDDSASVSEVEQGLIEVMPDAVMIVDSHAQVKYCSPGAVALGIADGASVSSPEIVDILARTVSDHTLREREFEVPLPMHARAAGADSPSSSVASGKGLQAGKAAPADKLFLRVRTGKIAEDLYAVLIRDVSEQRAFEQMRRDFVTNVSHELKTPAGAISLLAETVNDAADDSDAVRYFSSRISKESARLTELVGRLIDLQKAQDEEQHPDDVTTVNVPDLVREAAGENQVQAEAKHIELYLSIDGRQIELGNTWPEGLTSEKAMVLLNRDALKTAVKNLIENAIRYSSERTRVVIGVAVVDQSVIIRVVDQGIGIPQASLGRIFERFYRVDPARSRATGGTGLGLSIVKHCVEECGGTISVWSRESEGSTFTITLPLLSQEDGASR